MFLTLSATPAKAGRAVEGRTALVQLGAAGMDPGFRRDDGRGGNGSGWPALGGGLRPTIVMRGLVPRIDAFGIAAEGVDGRHKAGHDDDGGNLVSALLKFRTG
jgi:hypothetical protein